MYFPFKKGIAGYDYGVKTSYNAHHLGVDWDTNFEDLSAPKKSKIVNIINGVDMGLTLWFKPIGENIIIRWGHLKKIYVKVGDVVEEEQTICRSGNSGALTTGPHTHEDIWKNGNVTLKFGDTINPHAYYDQTMNNVEFVHEKGSSEYGFLETTPFTKIYHRASTQTHIKLLAEIFGVNVLNPDNTINFSLARDIDIVV